MDEDEFWMRLEYRVTAEFAGFADARLRGLWCDGLVPEDYRLSGPGPGIVGRAWCGASGQEPWRFTLILPAASVAAIDWSALLPGDALTGWLTPDPEARTMIIDPP